MSTEFSGARTQPQISPTAGTTLVEVTSEQVFRGSPNLDDDHPLLDSDEDKLMMTEYDEDNVIVIDLSEERNASAKNQLLIEDQPVPRQMFGSESMEEEDSEYAVDNNGGVHSEPEESKFFSAVFLLKVPSDLERFVPQICTPCSFFADKTKMLSSFPVLHLLLIITRKAQIMALNWLQYQVMIIFLKGNPILRVTREKTVH